MPPFGTSLGYAQISEEGKSFDIRGWSNVVLLECPFWIRLCVVVQWHQPEADIITDDALMSKFIPILE